MEAVYKRVLIKISGEALAGDKKTGFDFDIVSKVCKAVQHCVELGVEVSLVVGAGNFWRGVKDGAGKVERVSADRMGMLGTCMNCLAMCDVFLQQGAKARIMTAMDIQGVGERYDTRKSIEYMQNGEKKEIATDALIVAIGHSAADTQQMLYLSGVNMIQKPFSVGVRIEHPQSLINQSQYGKAARHPALGAAEYHLSQKLKDGRGVYTFCMCPGGTVVPAASRENALCVNGMSPFARDGQNANAALLIDVRTEDFGDDHPLAGYVLQRMWEEKAFRAGGSNYHAPVQLCGDFLAGKETKQLGSVTPTYRPGITCADLQAVLPSFAVNGLREALPVFDRRLKGFALPDAVMTAVESRSSCPVRLPRDERFESNIQGIFPCGEGAGYAGGIMSAAADGMRVAEALMKKRGMMEE